MRKGVSQYLDGRVLWMICIAFAVTGQFLILLQIPITPANDLARHVAMAENFFAALRAGQILPRLQEIYPVVPDLPLFQYYGFMTGLVALPGMLLGISAFKSLMLGVLMFRIAAIAGIYWAARLLGGNRGVSLLAALVYFMTPYIISNFYGRVAIPETLAHCELPFLVLGLLLGLRGFLAKGVTVLAVTILLLALTHPIFLLYGCGALVLMMTVSFSRNIIITGFSGLIIGILLSAFQWYPAMLTRDLLAFQSMVWSPDLTSGFTSARGLFSFPVSLLSEWRANPPGAEFDLKNLYLTPSWFTLPVFLALIIQLKHRENRTEKLMMLVPGLIFLWLSFGLFEIYRFLPHVTWAVQYPYRLLAFVALFTALALPILLPKLKKVGVVILAILAISQSAVLLVKPTYRTPLLMDAKTITSVYALSDYAILDKGKEMQNPQTLMTIERKKIGAYSREFQVKQKGSGTVVLPIAYSPFFVFTQNEHRLTARPDSKGRVMVTSNDLMQPIEAQYQLPLICYIAPIIGLMLLVGFARCTRKAL